jgi:sugar phosphate isomerase/epimerase
MTAPGLVLYSGTVIQATSFQQRLEAAVAGGFGAVSLFPHDYLAARSDGASDEDLRSALADAGVRVAAIDPVTTWLPGSAPAPGTPRELLDFAQHEVADIMRIATAVGAAAVNALEFWGQHVPVEDAAIAFGLLCDTAAEHGLRVHLEAMPFSGIPDLATAWGIVDSAGRDNGGLLLDAWHWFRGANRLEELQRVPGDRVFAVQLADGPLAASDDLPTESMTGRLLPGQGEWPLGVWLAAIRATGAEPTYGPEVFSSDLASADVLDVGIRAGDSTRAVLT